MKRRGGKGGNTRVEILTVIRFGIRADQHTGN